MLATLSAFTVSLTHAAYAADKQPLSLEFLEYLGTMVEHEGELLDPMHMEAEDVLADVSLEQPLNEEQSGNKAKAVQPRVEHGSQDNGGRLP